MSLPLCSTTRHTPAHTAPVLRRGCYSGPSFLMELRAPHFSQVLSLPFRTRTPSVSNTSQQIPVFFNPFVTGPTKRRMCCFQRRFRSRSTVLRAVEGTRVGVVVVSEGGNATKSSRTSQTDTDNFHTNRKINFYFGVSSLLSFTKPREGPWVAYVHPFLLRPLPSSRPPPTVSWA